MKMEKLELNDFVKKSNLIKTICFIIAAGLLIGGLGLFYVQNMFWMQQKEIKNYFYEVTEQEARFAENQISNDLKSMHSTALSFGNALRNTGIQQVVASLEEINDSNEFLCTGIVLPDGRAWIAQNGYDGLIEETDYDSKDYVAQALAGRDYLSRTVGKGPGGQAVNMYAVPIKNHDRILGVLIAGQNTKVFNVVTDNYIFNGAGFSHIVLSDGNLVVRSHHKDSNSFVQNIFTSPRLTMPAADKKRMMEDMKNDRRGVTFITVEDQKRWAVYVPIGVNNWYILCVVPAEAVNLRFNSFVIVAVVTALAVILFFIAVICYTRRLHFKYQNKLSKMAYFDSLTGCYNENMFEMMLAKQLKKLSGREVVAALGISSFKNFNSLFGMKMGDNLLLYMADVLARNLREGEFFGRITADRFHLCLFGTDEEAKARAEQISMEIASFAESKNKKYQIVVNFGLYRLQPQDDELEVKLVLDRADIARKNIRMQYRSRVCFFNKEMQELLDMKKQMEGTVVAAMESREFEVWLQPQYETKDHVMIGAEALVRWNHPERGLLAPGRFIPIFEEKGYAIQLDNYVLNEVCRKLREWIDKGYDIVRISVNQTRLHFYEPGYIENLNKIVDHWRIPYHLICLEVTESIVQENFDDMIMIGQKLRSLGYAVSMDDFGSGYSSLNVLTNMPVDELKLDKDFFKNSDCGRAQKIISNVLHMARDLQIKTVAEGIEDASQVEFLKSEGCDIIQGFYFARPMPMEQFEKIIDGSAVSVNNRKEPVTEN